MDFNSYRNDNPYFEERSFSTPNNNIQDIRSRGSSSNSRGSNQRNSTDQRDESSVNQEVSYGQNYNNVQGDQALEPSPRRNLNQRRPPRQSFHLGNRGQNQPVHRRGRGRTFVSSCNDSGYNRSYTGQY